MSLPWETRTLGEQWRANKPKDFKNATEYALKIQALDRCASVQKTDLGIVIKFSDGSLHRMGSSDKLRA